jgi:hypothetical protein
MKLSHNDYRAACDQAYIKNISNPTVYWNMDDGFYVAPSSDLASNNDLRIGLAYYSLNNDSARSLSGSRREYRPIAAGIRKFYATAPNKRIGTLCDYVELVRFQETDY